MKIDGRLIAFKITERLKKRILKLHKKNIIPHLAVILLNDDPSTLSFVRQKEKVGEVIGAKVAIHRLGNSSFQVKEKLITLLKRLNKDPKIHGIIIQRPVTIDIDKQKLDNLVKPQKDVDGFHVDSHFDPPIGKAVLEILKWVKNKDRSKVKSQKSEKYFKLNDWLKKKNILIIGRGETAGIPIAKMLKKINTSFKVAHSRTKNLDHLILNSDIIITCVGKPNIVRQEWIKNESIVLGVGLHTENGKLQPDFNQEKIAQKAAFWTPVPGGVGPVNVACLFENLVQATLKTLR